MKKYQKKILKKMGLPETEEALEKIKGKDLDKYNFLKLKMRNKKEYDYFEINEYRTGEKDIFEYKDLKEFDKEDYEFQKEHQTDVRKKYDSLYMQSIHFMAVKKDFLEKERITYGLLQSVRWYMVERVLEELREAIDDKYPSILKKDESFFKMTSMPKRKAAGKEKELEEILSKLYGEYHKIDDYIVEEIKDLDGYTFLIEGGEFMEGMDNYLIGGFEAAEKINFKTFFKDFYELEESKKIVEQRIEKVKDVFKKKLEI